MENPHSFGEFRDFAVRLAKEAGAIHLTYFRGNELALRTKSNIYDVVTRADRESEEHIARTIAECYPSHALLGEEGGERGAVGSDYRWVVDPLDGTTNYSQGLPVFTVSIALQYRGETVVGVVYAPYLDELFTAVRGEGACLTLRGGVAQQLHVGAKTTLAESVLATGFPYDKDVDPDNNSDNVARILPHVRDLRRYGSAAYDLACVASGWLDGFWELALHEWDVCAGILLVEEAGGRVERLRPDRGWSIVAGNTTLIAAMREKVG